MLPQESANVNTIKAAIYARFSSSAQREESIEDQLRVCREYCSAHSMTVVTEYTDHAISGLTDARPDFQQMIKDGEKHYFDTLVLYSLDRFARNKYDSAIYKARLKKAGIKIVYVTTPIGEGAEAILMETVLEGLANYYSENLARSVRRGMEGNALKALWNGTPPLGYKKVNKVLTPDPISAPWVQKIFEEYAVGRPMADIIRELNAAGARTYAGREFTRNSFQNVLKNRVYIGEYKWADIVHQDAITPLVSKETFEKVQDRLKMNNKTPAHAKANALYLLSGKLYCGLCGAPMIGESGKSHTGAFHYYYSCANRKRPAPGVPRCTKQTERKMDLETAVLKIALNALTDDVLNEVAEAAHNMLAREAEQADRAPALRAELKEIDNKISNILTAIEAGIFTASTRDRLTDLENQKAAISEQLEACAHPLPVLSTEELLFWIINLRNGSTESEDYSARLIDAFINSISITDDPDGKRIALIFNLKTNASRTYKGSDLMTLVHQHKTNPNPIMLSAEHFMMILPLYNTTARQ